MSKKLTNKIVDQRLIGRNIERLNEFKKAKTSMNWGCKICKWEWKASTDSILNKKSGCPKCSIIIRANKRRFSNEDIDKKLVGRDIERLSEYKNILYLMDWRCKICEWKWEVAANNILNSESGCPKCAGNFKLTNKDIDNKLIGRDIERLSEYKNIDAIMDWRCKICEYEWKANSDNVLNKKSDCPKCSNRIKLTNEDVDNRLIGRDIERLSEYKNIYTLMDWRCKICEYEWKTTPNSVLNQGSGCFDCSKSKNQKIIDKILRENNIDFETEKDIRKISSNANKYKKVDFYFLNHNLIIEYNGEQHYKPTRFYDMSEEEAKKNFIEQQARDKYVQEFCDQNNIKIISDGIKYKNNKLKEYILKIIKDEGIK